MKVYFSFNGNFLRTIRVVKAHPYLLEIKRINTFVADISMGPLRIHHLRSLLYCQKNMAAMN